MPYRAGNVRYVRRKQLWEFLLCNNPLCPTCFLGDAKVAGEIAEELLAQSIYVIAFSFPVVPRGEARIRVQLSASHTDEQVDRAVAAFIAAGKKRGII